jgi:hypothetical protein
VDDTLVGGDSTVGGKAAVSDAPVNDEVEGGAEVVHELVDEPDVGGEEVDEATVHGER